MNTLNWRIRTADNGNRAEDDLFFYIEGDLPNNSGDVHFPRVEVMQEDYGDHNGYTSNIRMADAKLIVAAPNMKDAIKDALEFMDMGEDEFINISWIRSRLQSAIKDL